MTLRAMLWALTEAPTDDPTEALVLVALADYAHDDGTSAFPSQATIAAHARISERTVRRVLLRLEANGLIRRGDQALVERVRVDRRPVVWDLRVPERGVRLTPRPDLGERGGSAVADNETDTAAAAGGLSRPNGGSAVADDPKDEPKAFNPGVGRVADRPPACPAHHPHRSPVCDDCLRIMPNTPVAVARRGHTDDVAHRGAARAREQLAAARERARLATEVPGQTSIDDPPAPDTPTTKG